jgi:3-dehydroquinate dehydratase II
VKNRVDILHGVNFDQLARRDPELYGGMTFSEMEVRIKKFARDLDLEVTFWQTNHEGEYCESLHIAAERADGLILNPGAWTHYSWAIRDALEICGLPAIEVHLSDVDQREVFRRVSVLDGVRTGRVAGKGVDGYRDALELLKAGFA